MFSRLIVLVLTLSAVVSCSYFVSWDTASASWIGRPVSEFIVLNGKPVNVQKSAQGFEEYKFELRKLDPSCIHYWMVNEVGVIISYRYEGRCRVIG